MAAGPLLAILLVALCAHVAILLVLLIVALLPRRRTAAAALAMAAGAATILGELLVLRAMIGGSAPLPLVVGALLAGIALSLATRPIWRSEPAGRLARWSLMGAPLAAAVVATLAWP